MIAYHYNVSFLWTKNHTYIHGHGSLAIITPVPTYLTPSHIRKLR